MMGMRGKWPLFFRSFKFILASSVLVLLVVIGLLLAQEIRTSNYQARFFAGLASKASYVIGAGPSPSIRFPQSAPFDDRLGYSELPAFFDKLKTREFEIVQQARISEGMTEIVDAGYFAPYREKTQTGLGILDCHNDRLFQEGYPKRVYERFDDIAPILVQSLLFIENRELLDASQPKRNPAVEWDRLANAVLVKARSTFAGEGRTPGGSTLATQIEKYRHASEGRTSSATEKLQQMVSAALRAYQHGEDTSAVRRQIVLSYVNTMPLSARAGFGEVHGLGDGLWVWYGRDFKDVNRILKNMAAENGHSGHDGDNSVLIEQAQLFKQALSLLIAQRRPSHYFDADEAELEQLTNSHLRLLGSADVITPALRDAALKAKLKRRVNKVPAAAVSFVTQKAANAVRTHLAGLLGGSRLLGLYDLDRLDLSVASTLDAPVQTAVTSLLRDLRNPASAKAAGLAARQLLQRGDPARVVYSFTLYERASDANYLRVQTDNFDQPLNINEGTKLDLGSTAKLRTLVTYLDIMDKLHQRLSGLDNTQLRALEVDRKDVLTRWAADYFLAEQDKSLSTMLDAALERRYSASTGEGFFTGGGLHHFDNFKREDNGRVMSLRDGLRNSVNLVFIRLMRDIVHHYMFLTPGSSAKLLQDADDPRRTAYLARFADREGQVFMRRFLAHALRKRIAHVPDALGAGRAEFFLKHLAVLRFLIHAVHAHFKATQGFLERLLEGAAHGHHLADRFHLRCQTRISRRKLFECKTRNLGHHVVDARFKAGWRGTAGNLVAQLVQRVATGQLGSDFRNRETGRLGSQCGGARHAWVHLDHDHAAIDRVDGELHIGATGVHANFAQHRQRCIAQNLVFLVGQGLRRGHRDRVTGMHPHGVEVFDGADDDAVVRLVAHHFHLKLFPAEQRLFNQQLIGGRGFQAALANGLKLFGVVGYAATRAAEREAGANDRGKAECFLHRPGFFHAVRNARAG